MKAIVPSMGLLFLSAVVAVGIGKLPGRARLIDYAAVPAQAK